MPRLTHLKKPTGPSSPEERSKPTAASQSFFPTGKGRADAETQERLRRQRWRLLIEIDKFLHTPMIILSFVWVGLIIIDYTSHPREPLIIAEYAIWALFALQFVIEFTIAPHKLRYLKRNWLIALSLALPIFRVGRIVRAVRVLQEASAFRAVTLIQILTSANRGMSATRRMFGRRKVGYILALAAVITFVGAAGMYQFENAQALRSEGFRSAVSQGQYLHSYGDSVWFAAMLLTTIGSQYWPASALGRFVAFLISLAAVGILGYVTAVLASFFVGQDMSVDGSVSNLVSSSNSSSSGSSETGNSTAAASSSTGGDPLLLEEIRKLQLQIHQLTEKVDTLQAASQTSGE